MSSTEGIDMGGLRRTAAVCALGLVLSVAGSFARGETVLLDFQTDWCGICQTMEPVVAQLAADGYHVRKINGDQQPDLVRKFHVDCYPTFVALCDDREVGRLSGKVGKANLKALLDKAGAVTRGATGERVRGQSPDSTRQTALQQNRTTEGWEHARETSGPIAAAVSLRGHEPLVAASVRLRIQDDRGQSTGSGTIIDARDGEALVLTCGHMFRECKEAGQILVDLFGPGAPKQIPGTLVSYDLNSDVGLVRIQGDYRFVAAKVAPASYRCRKGEDVVSVGCDNGADATPRATQIVSVDRYTHAPNLQVAFEPVQGRSGGGLFNSQGQVIGVCNAADAEDKQGLFAALGAIHAELNRTKLAFVYDSDASSDVQGSTPLAAIPMVPSAMPSASSSIDRDSMLPARDVPLVTTAGLSDEERALLGELRSARGAEVICLVRALDSPQAKSRVLQLNRASAAFWRELASDTSTGGTSAGTGRKLTSLDNHTDSPAATAQIASNSPAMAIAARKAGDAASTRADRVWPQRAVDR